MSLPPREGYPLIEASNSPKQSSTSLPHREKQPAADDPRPSLSSGGTGLESGCVPSETKLGPTPATGDEPTTDKSSSLKKAFTTLLGRKTLPQPETDGPEEAPRGPLGLHLVHESSEPVVELVFVHGLRGGSVKTWRKGEDQRFFWPKSFLPVDPDFRGVNIYSFGYVSDWGSTKNSILNVHDFGNNLLEAMRTSPHLRNRPKTPIILLGHSMGGLVVKKAYILARENKADPDFAARIQSVFFLATPHRGSNYAAVLNNVLKISGFLSSKQYLADLTTGSTSTQLINQDFCRYASDLHIFSFFETLEMNLGPTSALIVEKASAILGSEFSTERVQYINANHRDICKFDGSDDPNYLVVRDSLSTAIEILLKKNPTHEEVPDKAQMATLQSYLGVKGRTEADNPRVEGSCRWIEHREDFKQWISGGETNPGFYVVTAQPGAGKTVLASHVVAQLKEKSLSCSHHFFKAGNDQEQSLAGLFRSIAYQMASANVVFRNELLRLHEDGVTFAKDDARAIWLNLFRNGIFRISCTSPQYWVIDALDECPNYKELFTYLKGVDPSFQLRVMITSRVLPFMPRLLKTVNPNLASIEIPLADTLKDIWSYITSRADALPVDTEEERDSLSVKIQAKSQACFLWVRLVLDELENVYGAESVMEILESIPEGMIPYYQRAMDLMRKKRESEKRIAKAILRLAIAAARPLSTSELSQALELESKDLKLGQNVKVAVEGLCSYLAQVDANDIVHLVHLTAREFLLSEDAKEFQVLPSAAHEHLASTCLALLSAPELRPPAHPALLHQNRPDPSALLDYAATWFSHHVYSSSSERDGLLLALEIFFKTNVQSWIEHVASKGDLHCMLKTARDLRGHLDRRADHGPSMAMPVKVIGDWSTELTRLVPVFGSALVHSPTSVYFLVPRLAPTASAIHTQFGKTPGGLVLTGHENSAWDDCLATIELDRHSSHIRWSMKAFSCGPNFIGIGLHGGYVALYNHQSFQKQMTIELGTGKIDGFISDRSGSLLVTSCPGRLAAWDQEGELRWERRLTEKLDFLDLSGNIIVGFNGLTGQLLKWDSHDGTLLEDKTCDYRTADERPPVSIQALVLASVSPRMDVLATAYKFANAIFSNPVRLWSQGTNDSIGSIVDDGDRYASRLLFNPNPQINVLLVAYNDCKLSLYDSYTGAHLCSTVDHRKMILLDVTISPDGSTIAAVDELGLVTIRNFENLKLLYFRNFHGFKGCKLQFGYDSLSLIVCSGRSMKVWMPPVLNRKRDSIIDEPLELPSEDSLRSAHDSAELKVICAHPSKPFIVAGNRGCEIVAYSSVTGKEVGLLYAHRKTAYEDHIQALALSMDDLVASGDVDGNVFVYELDTTSPGSLRAGPVKLRTKFDKRVNEIHFIPGTQLLLIGTGSDRHTRSDRQTMLSLDGTRKGEFKSNDRWENTRCIFHYGDSERGPRLFLEKHLTLMEFDIGRFPAVIGTWKIPLHEDAPKLAWSQEMPISWSAIFDDILVMDVEIPRKMTRVVSHLNREGHVLRNVKEQYYPAVSLYLLDLKEMQTRSSTITPVLFPDRIAAKIRRRVVSRPGLASNKELLFLSKTNWLSGVSLDEQNVETYIEYFPVPNEILEHDGTPLGLSPIQTIDDDIVFAVHGKLAVFKNGLKHGHVRKIEDGHKGLVYHHTVITEYE